MMSLESLLAKFNSAPEEERSIIKSEVESVVGAIGNIWVPSPGPQTAAYLSDADELFYGGEAGGGKTDLIAGLALTSHHRSLVLRRTNKEATRLVGRFAEIIGGKDGWNGQEHVWRLGNGKEIEIGGCQHEDDKQKYKGNPHDFIGFDELSDFTETQYIFITTWNRTTVPGQRVRVVGAGNPPTQPEGLWVLKRWAAWLDPNHPNPAKDGELRWFTTGTNRDGEVTEIEVDGYGPHLIDGEMVYARSRTFIRAKLSDNPFQDTPEYRAQLASLPDVLRNAYRGGRFDMSLKDDEWQCIPSSWIREAQARWTPSPPEGVPMCSIGVDVAQGGDDRTVLSCRYDGWFSPLIAVPGKKTPMPRDVAGLVVTHRRDNAVAVIDMGGGYGGGVMEHLTSNNTRCIGYKGASESTARTFDKAFRFYNKRTEAYWKFREALDPGLPGGSWIALPDDPEMVADLAAPRFEIDRGVIKLETKEDVQKRIGRSPDKGDAIVMAWSSGDNISTIMASSWQNHMKFNRQNNARANIGYENRRR